MCLRLHIGGKLVLSRSSRRVVDKILSSGGPFLGLLAPYRLDLVKNAYNLHSVLKVVKLTCSKLL